MSKIRMHYELHSVMNLNIIYERKKLYSVNIIMIKEIAFYDVANVILNMTF